MALAFSKPLWNKTKLQCMEAIADQMQSRGWKKVETLVSRTRTLLRFSLQNRPNFLRISGEQRRKRGEREVRIACELALSASHATIALRARLAFASVRQKYARNYACSAG